jgi:hypothetical protein
VLCLHAQAGVFMNRYDAASTGANTHERILNVANVNPAGFGKLYTYYVDGDVYAQPLCVPAVAIPARTANGKVYIPNYDNSVNVYGLLGR